MMEPQDQAARDRFAQTLDRNFSVIAAAGSGKTRAVTDRIAQVAQASDAVRMLPRLVVLTFANRAADEMQQRAREQILLAKPKPEILAAFNRAWFGTIQGSGACPDATDAAASRSSSGIRDPIALTVPSLRHER